MNKVEFDKSEFMGVFYFTNWTDEDFVHLWNNEEYIFPKQTSVPMIMPKETPENVQQIRKRFAYDLATREFYKGKEYKRLVALGVKSGGIPPTFDEKTLEPMIEKCLNPLPQSRAIVRPVKTDEESKFKASKAISERDNPNYVFKDENVDGRIKTLGKMSDSNTL